MERAQVLKVVVVGPSDVQRECESVKSIADDLNETMRHGRIPAALQVLHWKTDSRPGAHILGPQGRIDEDLDIDDCDVLIGVFWRRFGTPVHDAESGTEHEIRRAKRLWEERRRPEVMLYFNQAPDNAATGDSAEQLI